MKKAIKNRWIKALRSGKFIQGQQQLRIDIDADGEDVTGCYDEDELIDRTVVKQQHCCLGVLCEVMKVDYDPTEGGLPGELGAEVGLDKKLEDFLVCLNDGATPQETDYIKELPKGIQRMKLGKARTFKQIANVIEKYA